MSTVPPAVDLSASQQPSLLAGNVITFALATTAVALRFLARRLNGANLWWDDWLALAGWCSGLICFVDVVVWVSNGVGRHYETLNEPLLEVLRYNFLQLFIEEIFYSTTTIIVKLSVLALYWRIFPIPSIRWPIKIMAAIAISWLIARVVTIIFHCIPVEAFWDKTIQGACHVSDREFFLGTNIANLFMDVTILSLPVPYISSLQMKKSSKITLLGIFALGGFVSIASILLIVYSYTLDESNPDITWTLSQIVLWAGAEINLGIVCACLPCLRPVWLLITKGSPSSERRNCEKNTNSSGTSGQGSKRVMNRWLAGPKSRLKRTIDPFSTFAGETSQDPINKDEEGTPPKVDVVIEETRAASEETADCGDSSIVQKELQIDSAEV